MKEIYQKLRSLTGKSYGLYKSLAQKTWKFGDFELDFLHVQGDPYAPPSRLKFRIPLSALGFSPELANNAVKRLALADFLLRRLAEEITAQSVGVDFPISIANPGQEILTRNSLWVGGPSENEGVAIVEATLWVKLPGDHRMVDVPNACDILTSILPDTLSTSLYCFGDGVIESAKRHIESLEVRTELLAALEMAGLVAFVPDGAILPRASGISELPLASAVSFKSPPEMRVTLKACGREITGMGIPKGITVIAGGAYHGKSTLLSALEKAVYPHIPGDGREWIVVDSTAVRICDEGGRSVRNTRIAPLVRELPSGISTENFSTLSASGSTSEASNLLEAIEFGTHTVLIDEDTSAVNFLIRDPRMQKLVGASREPLIPLIDRARELTSLGLNIVLVAGACGDYLNVADTVIVMNQYQPEWATHRAKEICASEPPHRLPEDHPPFIQGLSRSLLAYVEDLLPHVRPTSPVERQVKVRVQGGRLQIGFVEAEIGPIPQFCDSAQRYGAGLIVLNLLQNAVDKPSLECIEKICAQIANVGFRKIPQGMNRDVALPRPAEIAMTLLRLRNY